MTRAMVIAALLVMGCGGREVDDGRTNVSGIVFKGERTHAVSGATVSVPSQVTTTDGEGRYSLRVEREEAVVLEARSASLLSALVSVVPSRGGLSGVDLALLDRSYVNEKLGQAGLPAMDPGKGLVVIAFDRVNGGEGASLSATSDGSLTVTKQTDRGVKSSTLIAGGTGALVFSNVAPGSTGVTLKASGCSLRFPGIASHPVRAGSLTKVDARCP